MDEKKVRPLIAVDSDIPFIRGRLEPFCDVRYLSQDEFTPVSVRDADGMIIRTRTRCDKALLEGSAVKVIATATIGMDQFNLADCRELGIEVHNSPGCNAPGVAQYVWSSVLRLGLRPEETVIGVVGAGNVGSIVAEWGRDMGASVLLNDPPLESAGGGGFVSLEEMIPRCDVVTVHTPYSKSGDFPTHHLIGEKEIALMKPGAVVINAARGPVTDTRALCRGIREKGVRCVIDCWEGEPHTDPELLSLAEIATYHIAGYSLEGKQRATRMAMTAIADYFGFTPDISGLAAPYIPGKGITPERIAESFDPEPVMRGLRGNPGAFDRLRAEYKYRKEP